MRPDFASSALDCFTPAAFAMTEIIVHPKPHHAARVILSGVAGCSIHGTFALHRNTKSGFCDFALTGSAQKDGDGRTIKWSDSYAVSIPEVISFSVIMCMFILYIHKYLMRTNIVIDDELMAKAIEASGLSTKKDVVEQGLKLIIQRSNQQAIRELRGRLKWEGDLDEMRGGK